MSARSFFRRVFFRDRPAVGAAVAVVLTASGILFWHAAVHVFAWHGWMCLLPIPVAAAAVAVYGVILTLLFLFSVLRRDFAMRRRWAVPLALVSAVVPLVQPVVMILAARRRDDRRTPLLVIAASLAYAVAGGIVLSVAWRPGPIPAFGLVAALVVAALFLHLAVLRRFGSGERDHRGAAMALAAVVVLGIVSYPGFYAGCLSRLVDARRNALAARIGVDIAAPDPDPVLPENLDYPLFKAVDEDKDIRKLSIIVYDELPFSDEDCADFDDWCAHHADFLATVRALTDDDASIRWHFPEPQVRDYLFPWRCVNEGHTDAYLSIRRHLRIQGWAAITRGDLEAYRDAERRLAVLARSIAPPTSLADYWCGIRAEATPFELLGESLAILTEEDFGRAERAATALSGGGIANLRVYVKVAFRRHVLDLAAAKEHLRCHVFQDRVDPLTLRYALSGDELRVLEIWEQSLDCLAPLLGKADDGTLPDFAYLTALHDQSHFLARQAGKGFLGQMNYDGIPWDPERLAEKTVVKPRLVRDIVRAGIAVERFRRAHGALPASLEELVPEFLHAVPADFRTGRPFDYKSGDFEDYYYGDEDDPFHGFCIEAPWPYWDPLSCGCQTVHNASMYFAVPR